MLHKMYLITLIAYTVVRIYLIDSIGFILCSCVFSCIFLFHIHAYFSVYFVPKYAFRLVLTRLHGVVSLS